MRPAYRLTEDYTLGDQTLNAGLTVYEFFGHDYGSASGTSFATQQQHISVTLDAKGDGPFITVPVRILEGIPTHPPFTGGDRMAQTMADNEERRFRDRVGEVEYARLKEIERTQGLEAARAEARKVERDAELSKGA